MIVDFYRCSATRYKDALQGEKKFLLRFLFVKTCFRKAKGVVNLIAKSGTDILGGYKEKPLDVPYTILEKLVVSKDCSYSRPDSEVDNNIEVRAKGEVMRLACDFVRTFESKMLICLKGFSQDCNLILLPSLHQCSLLRAFIAK